MHLNPERLLGKVSVLPAPKTAGPKAILYEGNPGVFLPIQLASPLVRFHPPGRVYTLLLRHGHTPLTLVHARHTHPLCWLPRLHCSPPQPALGSSTSSPRLSQLYPAVSSQRHSQPAQQYQARTRLSQPTQQQPFTPIARWPFGTRLATHVSCMTPPPLSHAATFHCHCDSPPQHPMPPATCTAATMKS